MRHIADSVVRLSTRRPLGSLLRIPRQRMIAALYGLGLVNGLAPDVAATIEQSGWLVAAAATFGISVVVLLAGAAGLRCALISSATPATRPDFIVAGLFTVLMLVPNAQIAWIALSLLAFWELARPACGRSGRAGGFIIVALAIHQLWGKIALNLLAVPLTNAEAASVAWLLGLLLDGVTLSGNIIENGHGYSLAVVAGCSSFLFISSGLLVWITITQTVRASWRPADIGIAALVVAAMVALNHLRLLLISYSLPLYQALHNGAWGEALALVTTAVAMAISFYGVRDELRHPAARG